MDNARPSSEQSGDGAADSRRKRQVYARDAAADERDAAADERDAAADERESQLRVREVRQQEGEPVEAELRGEVREILDAAEVRDEEADQRDAAAGERDSAASLHSFLRDDENSHDAALKARRSAARDRVDAHIDRGSSAVDRSKLAGRTAEPSDDPE